MRILVLGEVILDRDVHGAVARVAPDAPVPVVDVERRDERPGGAGLVARLLAHTGADVRLAAPFASDGTGARLRSLLEADRITCLPITTARATHSVTRVRSDSQSLIRIDEHTDQLARDATVEVTAVEAELTRADAVVVADYGAGLCRHEQLRRLLGRWATRRVMVWDPHPRGAEPVPGVHIVTPNRGEALGFVGATVNSLDVAASTLRERWRAGAVAATDGAAGVLTAIAGSPTLFVPAPFVVDGDSCGAGDRFTASVAVALVGGASVPGAVATAVGDVAAWLRDGGVTGRSRLMPDPVASGGNRGTDVTVVATGGCFDVLHAGHVASLQAARRLGDRLVVLLNSDASVRRLKGPARPVQSAADRARVLGSLACVDEVRVFDEDTPETALAELRPDVWAKGGDYAGEHMPEAALVTSWGGRIVLLPHLPGRSTTRILTHVDQHTTRERTA
ncbi:MAG TPA: PfkB family carbohydrate kinase [Mycobacteriales bacterium]